MPTIEEDKKGVSILARSLFRQMQAQGYSKDPIVALSAELITLLQEELVRDQERELAAQ